MGERWGGKREMVGLLVDFCFERRCVGGKRGGVKVCWEDYCGGVWGDGERMVLYLFIRKEIGGGVWGGGG